MVNLSKERIGEDKLILADEFYANSMLGDRKLILIRSEDNKLGFAMKTLLEDNDFAKKSDNFILILLAI